MKLEAPNGQTIEASIQKKKDSILIQMEFSSGGRTKEEAIARMQQNEFTVSECKLIEATDRERELLKEGKHTPEGL